MFHLRVAYVVLGAYTRVLRVWRQSVHSLVDVIEMPVLVMRVLEAPRAEISACAVIVVADVETFAVSSVDDLVTLEYPHLVWSAIERL